MVSFYAALTPLSLILLTLLPSASHASADEVHSHGTSEHILPFPFHPVASTIAPFMGPTRLALVFAGPNDSVRIREYSRGNLKAFFTHDAFRYDKMDLEAAVVEALSMVAGAGSEKAVAKVEDAILGAFKGVRQTTTNMDCDRALKTAHMAVYPECFVVYKGELVLKGRFTVRFLRSIVSKILKIDSTESRSVSGALFGELPKAVNRALHAPNTDQRALGRAVLRQAKLFASYPLTELLRLCPTTDAFILDDYYFGLAEAEAELTGNAMPLIELIIMHLRSDRMQLKDSWALSLLAMRPTLSELVALLDAAFPPGRMQLISTEWCDKLRHLIPHLRMYLVGDTSYPLDLAAFGPPPASDSLQEWEEYSRRLRRFALFSRLRSITNARL